MHQNVVLSSCCHGPNLVKRCALQVWLLIFFVVDYNDNIDESEAIARAIAESQNEYIQSVLKKQ